MASHDGKHVLGDLNDEVVVVPAGRHPALDERRHPRPRGRRHRVGRAPRAAR